MLSFGLFDIIALTLTQIVNMHANRTENRIKVEWNEVDSTRYEFNRGVFSELDYRCNCWNEVKVNFRPRFNR